MSCSVSVHWLPILFSPEELRGGVAVVIDVLRASTTIAQALSAGAKAVVPCGEVSEAQTQAANLPQGSSLLGGERGGVKIAGFDLGNSPLDYTPERVSGRTVFFTTTNGTNALLRCKLAEQIVIGSFANLEAVAKHVSQTGLPVHLVCAGTNGKMSAEDILCAGAFVSAMKKNLEPSNFMENDATRMAFALYASHSQSETTLFHALCESTGGRNLMALGYRADIEWAANCNRFQSVPKYNLDTGRIELIDCGSSQ